MLEEGVADEVLPDVVGGNYSNTQNEENIPIGSGNNKEGINQNDYFSNNGNTIDNNNRVNNSSNNQNDITNQNIIPSQENSQENKVIPNQNKPSEKPTERPSGKPSEKLNNKINYLPYIIVLLVIFVIIIILVVAIIIYKRKYLREERDLITSLDDDNKPGNLMEKIQAIEKDNANKKNNSLINFSMANIISTSFSNNESRYNNGYSFNNENNDYGKTFENIDRGLKPPPARENNTKKKNIIKVKSNTPLKISTKRKSKNSDISSAQKTNSGSFSINRTSTEMSLALTQGRLSHCSSNGGFGYKNNKLNKHSSVALTFGCQALSEKEYDSTTESPNTTSPNRISIQTNNQSSVSSRLSSQRNITSFIANRISSYIRGHKKDSEYERGSYTDESSSRYTYNSKSKSYLSGNDFTEIVKDNNSHISNKKSDINIDTSLKNKERDDSNPFTSPVTSSATDLNENSSEQLLNKNHEYITSFISNNNNEKLDLSLSIKKY
jgi:hypothetical protein